MDEFWQTTGVIAAILYIVFVFAASIGSFANSSAIDQLRQEVKELQQKAAK